MTENETSLPTETRAGPTSLRAPKLGFKAGLVFDLVIVVVQALEVFRPSTLLNWVATGFAVVFVPIALVLLAVSIELLLLSFGVRIDD